MAGPRILTFNFHEPYLCLMAKTGFDFTIGLYTDPPLARPWHTHYRPMPKNMAAMEEPVWKAELAAGNFDVVITHNETNALGVFKTNVPKVLVCHNRRTFLRTTVSKTRVNGAELYDELIAHLQERFRFVFISESKRDDYGVPGDVILPGIDVEEFGGYTGDVSEVLRVGNMMVSRNLMFDVSLQERACKGIRNRVAGVDPEMPKAREAASFGELLNLYRTRRCLLHVTREEYEDGYNLSMLEAMACGMPVVALANRTCPLTHGIDGLISTDGNGLHSLILELFHDQGLAFEIGARGRETVARKFPISAFVENWRRIIEEAAEKSVRRRARRTSSAPSPATPTPPVPSLNVLIHYVASPITTGRYFERAIRKSHNVVTAGIRCPEEVFDLWGFKTTPPPYAGQDVELPLDATCAALLPLMPPEFKPDVYLWLDSGPSKVPSDLDALAVRKACYLIDTHISADLRIEMARHFDIVFLAQKGQVEQFRNAGIANVSWLPLACSPELHNLARLSTNARPSGERKCDVAFVGSMGGEWNDRRHELLRRVQETFPNNVVGQFWPEDMARIYAVSKIVVNVSANRDLNMRVFEAMASGTLLITDEADGLDDLFRDGEHLVVYHNDADLLDLIAKYLHDDRDRERIAEAGRQLTLEQHTYDHRVETMFARINDRHKENDASRFGAGGYYRLTRPEIAQFVPMSCARLLDIGCGAGDFASALKEKGVREAHGVEIVERAWSIAKEKLDSCILGDIERIELPFDDGYFDCITCGDVLEHLKEPAAVLRKAARVLRDDGIIIMSLPNVRFYQVIEMLGAGRWQYADAGILDRTHLRFFTAVEMCAMVEEAGLDTLKILPLSATSETQVTRNPDGSFTMGRVTIQIIDDADFRDLLTYQYLLIAGKPHVDRLARARHAVEMHADEAAYILALDANGVDDLERKKIVATAAARLGHLVDAEKLYREITAVLPDALDVAGEYGILLVAMNRTADARPYLEKAAVNRSGNERVIGALGLVHLAEGRLHEALECFRSATETCFDNPVLIDSLMAVAAQLGQSAEIAEIVRHYADFYPGNVELGCAYAELLIDMKKWSEARERLETILLFYPAQVRATELIGRLNRESQGGTLP